MNNDILNINVISLKNALLSCKFSIEREVSKQLIEKVSNSLIWQADSQKNLKNALSTLNNVHYENLQKEIAKYEQAVGLIESFQNLNSANIEIKRQIENLRQNLYYEETRSVTTYFLGKPKVTEKTVRVKDYGVEGQIVALEGQKANNEREMESLKSQITNTIY